MNIKIELKFISIIIATTEYRYNLTLNLVIEDKIILKVKTYSGIKEDIIKFEENVLEEIINNF